jgi:hypothetical protein
LATIGVCVFCAVASVAALFYFCNNGRCSNKFNIVIKEGIFMPDYKQMYLNLLDNVEKAIQMLKNAEVACEEIYINTDEQ